MTKKMTLKERIDQLPELPVETFEATGELCYADNVPVVTIRPEKFPEPVKPSGVLLAPNKSSAAQRRYWTQVTYPRVICQHPGDLELDPGHLFVEQGKRDSDRPNGDVAALAQRERFYKLSALKGARLRHPLWCSVKYGPWLAIVVEQEFVHHRHAELLAVGDRRDAAGVAELVRLLGGYPVLSVPERHHG